MLTFPWKSWKFYFVFEILFDLGSKNFGLFGLVHTPLSYYSVILVTYFLKEPAHLSCLFLESHVADCIPAIFSVLPYSFYFLRVHGYWSLPVSLQAVTCSEGDSVSGEEVSVGPGRPRDSRKFHPAPTPPLRKQAALSPVVPPGGTENVSAQKEDQRQASRKCTRSGWGACVHVCVSTVHCVCVLCLTSRLDLLVEKQSDQRSNFLLLIECTLVLLSHYVVSDSLQPMNCGKSGFPVLNYLLEIYCKVSFYLLTYIPLSHNCSSFFLLW